MYFFNNKNTFQLVFIAVSILGLSTLQEIKNTDAYYELETDVSKIIDFAEESKEDINEINKSVANIEIKLEGVE